MKAIFRSNSNRSSFFVSSDVASRLCARKSAALALIPQVMNAAWYGAVACLHSLNKSGFDIFGEDESKKNVTVADVLRHEGGMPVFNTQMKVEDCYAENLSNNVVGNIIEKQGLKYPEGEFK